MSELEEFHLDLYHAKLQYMGEGAALKAGLWDQETQGNIDALTHLCIPGSEIEPHIIAAKNHFRDRISYPEIIAIIKVCCKNHTDPPNKHAFTNAFFNRLKLHLKE